MKVIILFITCLMISSNIIFGQANTFPTSGNAGIGSVSPTTKLAIQANTNDDLISFLNSSGSIKGYAGLAVTDNQMIPGSAINDLIIRSESQKIMFSANAGITAHMTLGVNGNIGIGTAAPASLFDVFGRTAGGNIDINFRNQPGVNTSGTRTNMNFPVFNGAPGLQISEMTASTGGFNVGTYDALISTGQGSSYLHLAAGNARTPQITLKFTGDVGIGTTTPGAKLDVNGTTYSRQIYVGIPDANTLTNLGSNNLLAVNGTAVFVKAKVALYGAWPDYVFHKEYKLPTLDEIEQFIKLNGHLPEVPTSKEVEKNGIDLGNNQVLLLKKVEELTLIVIEQDKKIEEIESKLLLLLKRE